MHWSQWSSENLVGGMDGWMYECVNGCVFTGMVDSHAIFPSRPLSLHYHLIL